ncbi:MAG: asparagine synthase (glutamine-hydrolyzing) [Candidatus Rokubacteria bacterium]|nr:asparagine synthase (glutamine-hydrolyzing) [Candidatus Rokubacteria bacterium]
MAGTFSQGAGTAVMCGIAGMLGSPDPRTLDQMLDALDHRGPDDRGVYAADDVALGMTRLAIIDLGGGRQPMLADDGGAALVFNGEIYNFRELRARLAAKGRRFRTDSDTEVLLRAWEEYGELCVAHLSGMFAFAVWDARRRRLFLARDRLGKKPLYYWRDGRHFAFASELKALVRHPGPGRTPDWEAFHHYLAFGYTPSDRSMLASVGKLPPAHVAMIEGGVLTLRRYWALPDGRTLTPIDGRIDELAARVRRDVRDAVRCRLAADVPLGVFLSGGVDSSVIVASMREITSGRIATFSVGFGPGTRSYDELPHARRIAERFETDHHEEILEPDARQLAQALVRHFDEPFADSSAIPTLMIAGVAARHVKVVLSGIGGDEAFAGYPRYLGVRLSDTYARVPRWARAATDAMLGHVPESDSSRNIGDRVRRFLSSVDQPMPDRYIGWTRFFTEHQLASLATDALRRSWTIDVEAVRRDAYARRGHDDAMDGAFRIDLSTYVPDDLLTMADRMTMARSLELRAPFCDHRLIETSLAIAPALKTQRLQLKALLKRAFADVLPREILDRPKQGFMIPLGPWLRGALRPLMDELLAPDVLRRRGVFRPDAVEALRRQHLAGGRSHADRLWTLMMFELWVREYLDDHGSWRAA